MPDYYVQCACEEANYRYHLEWQELTEQQKAQTVAHYFAKILINSAKDETVQEKIESDSRKRSAK